MADIEPIPFLPCREPDDYGKSSPEIVAYSSLGMVYARFRRTGCAWRQDNPKAVRPVYRREEDSRPLGEAQLYVYEAGEFYLIEEWRQSPPPQKSAPTP